MSYPALIFRSCVLVCKFLHFQFLFPSVCDYLFDSCPELPSKFPPLVVFGVNDVYDYESDKRNPRKVIDGLEGGLLDPIFHSDVLKAAYCSTVFIITSALITGGRENVIATILLVVLGWQYSSPPLRLKEIPILDSLSNGGIVFLAWFCGFSFSGLSIFEIPSKGIMLSLCTTGIHALGAVMDTEADMASGQRTIATAFGKRPAAIFAALC